MKTQTSAQMREDKIELIPLLNYTELPEENPTIWLEKLRDRKPDGYIKENSLGTGKIKFFYGRGLLVGEVAVYPELAIYHIFDHDILFPDNPEELPELLRSYSRKINVQTRRYSIHEFPPLMLHEKLQGIVSGGHIDFDKKTVSTEMVKYLMNCTYVELSMFLGEQKELLEKLLSKEEVIKLITEG
jgi:hypothetical protein